METVLKKINDLELQMQQEQDNNFPNGDLWNELSDKVRNLKRYGQETLPDVAQEELSEDIEHILWWNAWCG